MERRAASHTEEEEMNQRRKLLNAARRGDPKAIGKLFELYQVRVLSGDQLAKVNRTSTYLVPVKPTKGGKSASKVPVKVAKSVSSKRVDRRKPSRAKASIKARHKKPVKRLKPKSRPRKPKHK